MTSREAREEEKEARKKIPASVGGGNPSLMALINPWNVSARIFLLVFSSTLSFFQSSLRLCLYTSRAATNCFKARDTTRTDRLRLISLASTSLSFSLPSLPLVSHSFDSSLVSCFLLSRPRCCCFNPACSPYGDLAIPRIERNRRGREREGKKK